MSTLAEVEAAVKVLTDNGLTREDITLLHCTTQYPTPFEAVNLRAMQALTTLNCAGVGYSDHTVGIEVPIAAAAMGATVIEKHFTLDKNMEGPDHRASLDPAELAAMVRAVRNVESSLGSGVKEVADAERANIEVARKSIVAAHPIKKGEVLTEENITVKRPGNGISPMQWDAVIGTRAVADFDYDALITL
jgi:N,N'-diacetyllegionaminate synthase